MGIGTARSAVFGLTLAVTSFWAATALCQPQPPVQAGASTTAEERQAAEKAVLGDPRVRAILGAGPLRVAAGDVEVDKGEAESFLAGTSERPPSKRVLVLAFSVQTNKAARAVVSLPEYRVLAVERTPPDDMPLVREDAEQALALAKADPGLRRAVGDTLDRYTILEPGSEERVPFAAQVLPLRNSSRRDACSVDRCLALIFRTEDGYLSIVAQVNLTRRKVAVSQGGGQSR
jgi:hypothetical protein